MIDLMIGIAAILGTLFIYIGSLTLYQRLRSPITLPVFVSTIVVSCLLLVSNVSYDAYMKGGAWVDWFLGPAVVALAYPLYKQRAILKSFMIPIVSSVTVGAVIGISSGITLLKWAEFEPSIIYSIVPKNATTPVAMPVAKSLGGIPSLAAVFVIFAGIVGAVMGPSLFKWTRITHFLGKGVGMGTASHAIGTSKAMEESEEEGAVSTVAMILGAIVISFISPLVVFLLL
ncbi:LrgB family protein [Pontibacillus yanchengensis]|uniref:LrgB family protein n=2 Tax=Pontibacillus yanchengensis TaxID=462910 RepID=A0ACC7VJ90_9BACI|nr:LrgB family protein [Pontibacillus yanchengensis]MYL35248.1 LrgB family protein [Pontibacillus yanchengensis]MYL54858.1 LrgB family protein [Pontibacillus yanchengensis]